MVTKKGEKEGWGKFWVFFPCPTPGPPQRDFPSAAAFEVYLIWVCFALNQSCPIWTCISHVPGALYPRPPSPQGPDVCSVPVQPHWEMFEVGSPEWSCLKGWECQAFLTGLPWELRAGPEAPCWHLHLWIPLVLSSLPSPSAGCCLCRECSEALKSTQAAKNNSNKNKGIIKARYNWSEVTASVTWLSQIPRTVGDRKGRREENLYLFKVLGPKLLTSRLW